MKKILYIDRPFLIEKGGDKNRSRFIWNTLNKYYDVDLYLIQFDINHKIDLSPYSTIKNIEVIKSVKSKWFHPRSINAFDKTGIEQFTKHIKRSNYDAVFIRFAAPGILADKVREVSPSTTVIIDIDMLQSRLAWFSWIGNKTLRNKFYLFETLRLKHFEQKFFRKPFYFLFTNQLELDIVADTYLKNNNINKLKLLNNVMHFDDTPVKADKKPWILFYGMLNSSANQDAFEYLISDIYPHLEKKLLETKHKIIIVGRNETTIYKELLKNKNSDTIELIGDVDDLQNTIASSKVVVLPLRIASGTRTRILEVANTATPVVTTKLGSEGLLLGEEEITLRESGMAIAQSIIEHLENKKMADEKGQKLYKKCFDIYHAPGVAKKLNSEIDEWIKEK